MDLLEMCGLQETHRDLLLLNLKMLVMRKILFEQWMEEKSADVLFELRCRVVNPETEIEHPHPVGLL